MQRGQVSDHPFFIPCTFQLLDGRLSLIPIDEETELLCLQIFHNAPTNSTGSHTPVLELDKLQYDLYYADALERFWLLQLKHMNAGKPCVCFQGWDEQGRAILNPPSMENEEFKKVVMQSVGACEIEKTKAQEQIRKLTDKAP
jgi:hypothetical protein